MVKKLGGYDIPYDKHGNQLDYEYSSKCEARKPNEIFEDVLTYSHYEKGRSSIGFKFVRTDGTYVNVFATDMDKFIPLMKDGKITERFCFVKRGMSYGCTIFET